jgi:hypothetical protein
VQRVALIDLRAIAGSALFGRVQRVALIDLSADTMRSDQVMSVRRAILSL